jgi:hypothetical protein
MRKETVLAMCPSARMTEKFCSLHFVTYLTYYHILGG